MVLGNDGYYLDPRTRHITQLYLYRDPKLGTAVEFYLKLPHSMPDRDVIVVSSVLATGSTASAAVRRVQEAGARHAFICGDHQALIDSKGQFALSVVSGYEGHECRASNTFDG